MIIICRKIKRSKEGFVLIELVLSILLFSTILVSMSTLFNSTYQSYRSYTERLAFKYDAQIVLKYIEKRIMECNQESIIYYKDKNIFEGRNMDNKILYVDLSGALSYKENTMINFYKPKNEIRVNKNRENNVLNNNIKEIIITEIVEGELIEFEVITNKGNYSKKIRLKFKYQKV
ncbi:PulJ/GspJ family protein [Alkaliphilus oremlandii]|nr:hypothetical protein [Alkaliphilus oremlandii]